MLQILTQQGLTELFSFDYERTWLRLFQKRVLCTTFDILLLSLCRWRTIIPRGHHQPSSQCFGTDLTYYISIIDIFSY